MTRFIRPEFQDAATMTARLGVVSYWTGVAAFFGSALFALGILVVGGMGAIDDGPPWIIVGVVFFTIARAVSYILTGK